MAPTSDTPKALSQMLAPFVTNPNYLNDSPLFLPVLAVSGTQVLSCLSVAQAPSLFFTAADRAKSHDWHTAHDTTAVS